MSSAILAGVTACAPPVPQDLTPAANAATTQELHSAGLRMESEADYTSHGTITLVKVGPHAGILEPAGFTGTPRTSFYTQEGIVAVADITWSEPTPYGGFHSADWRLLRNNVLLKEKLTKERLSDKPAHILSHISAESFPPGNYRLELLMDQKPFATLPFSIDASPAPAPLTTPISSPDCAGAPLGPIKPVNRLRPEFPSSAEGRHAKGCASVSIVLDNDGHPSGVRVDAEYPKNIGFGRAAARAVWGAVFPPGHGGETTYMTIHFVTLN
jgi:hypothetical protein